MGSPTADNAAMAPHPVASGLPPTPPLSPGAQPQRRLESQTSLQSVHSAQSTLSAHQEYLDHLVVPSNDEFNHIAEIQAGREAEHRRQRAESVRRSMDAEAEQRPQQVDNAPHKPSLSQRLHLGHSADDLQRAKAASLIQRNYRGYRVRRQMKGLGIDANTRWIHAIREAQYRQLLQPRARPRLNGESAQSLETLDEHGNPASRTSTAREKWKKAAVVARRAGGDQDSDEDSDSSSLSTTGDLSPEERERRRKMRQEAKERQHKEAKTMGLQYFLEMVDLKHRYGSNLRLYHEEWKKSDTDENFFYWLDHGEGRHIELDACPRERLDRERVRYLSREERMYYLVKTDDEGRLCWAKNGVRIDTTIQWKDSIHGIVPADDPTPAFRESGHHHTRLLGDSDTGSSDSEDGASDSEIEAAEAAKYATPGLDQAKGMKKIKHVSAATIFNKLMRKSVKKNTWIFVADTSFRLYVGIKNTGAFQHSSFLQGSRISAAGLIKIKNGRLASLSPLSGHYRPPAANFRAFVKSLKEGGVDMSHVSISKAYAVLVGLEAYVKTRRKGKNLVAKITHKKDKVVAPEAYRQREEAAKDTSESAAREREVLAEEEREREENKASVQLLQKLHIAPSEPKGQRDTEPDGKENRDEVPRGDGAGMKAG